MTTLNIVLCIAGLWLAACAFVLAMFNAHSVQPEAARVILWCNVTIIVAVTLAAAQLI